MFGNSVRVLALEVPRSISINVLRFLPSRLPSLRPFRLHRLLLCSSSHLSCGGLLIFGWLPCFCLCQFVQLNYYTNAYTSQARPFYSRQQCSIEFPTAFVPPRSPLPHLDHRQHEHAGELSELEHPCWQSSGQSVSRTQTHRKSIGR